MAADVGTKLRQARETRGLSLRQVADATRIPLAALVALERNDASKLPGGIFTRGFVRSYAREVGLDPDETMGEFLVQFAGEPVVGPSSAEEREANETIESQQRMAAITLRLVTYSAALAGLVLYFTAYGPARRQTGSDAPEPSAVGTVALAGGAHVQGEDRAAEETPVATGGAPSLDLVLEATGPCWVLAEVDGRQVLVRELGAGERFEIADGQEILLRVGDPGALRLTINGESARPLGASGRPVTLRLTPKNAIEYLARP